MYKSNYRKRLYDERIEQVIADKELDKKIHAKRKNRKESTSDNSNMSSICVQWDFSNTCE
jgi:hypothetical protein